MKNFALKPVLSVLTLCLFTSVAPAQTIAQEALQKWALDTLYKDAGLKNTFPRIVVAPQVLSISDTEDLVTMSIEQGQSGQIQLSMKGPSGFYGRTDKSLRALVLVTGFQTGADSVALMESDPNTVLVGFAYPVNRQDIEKDPTNAVRLLRWTPSQLAVTFKYLTMLPFVNGKKVVPVGISLGGLFLPVSLALAERMGFKPEAVILGYTGAHIAPIVNEMLKKDLNDFLRKAAVHQINNIAAPLDPKNYLDKITAPTLLIQATEEQIFPQETLRNLREGLKGQVTERFVAGPHITPDNERMIEETVVHVREFVGQLPQ